MDTVLGLIGIAVWIVAVIVLAAAVTWIVMKAFPPGKDEKPAAGAEGGG